MFVAREINVLFVDDEVNILNSLRRLFITETYDIATTSSLDEAWAILAREKIKVIVSDQRMPGMMGVELLKQVKAKHPDTIRILFTGYTDFQAAEEAINLGEVYRFISKPWNTTDLKATIKQALAHYDLVITNRQLFEDTKRQNAELEILNRKFKAMYEAQREFTSTVSHELRTPLAAIMMAIDIILSGTAGDTTEQQKNFLGMAKNNIDRLSRLINDVLDLARLESGRVGLNIQMNDLHRVVKDVGVMQKGVANKKGLSFQLKLDETVPSLPFDQDKLAQVLNNLLNNAIKFTDQGGVMVATNYRRDGNHVEVSVADTGPGIQAEDVPKLFQKFKQLEDPALNKTGGTGLGLAICREIVRQHGGKIWVESEVGKGSCFIFVLPITERRIEEHGS